MMNKTDILAIAKQFIRHQQGKQVRRIIHPRREWAIGVLCFTVLISVGAGVGWWQYERGQVHNIILPETASVRVPTYDSEMAGQLLETFDARRARFEVFQASALLVPVIVPAYSSTTASSTVNDGGVVDISSTPSE